MDVSSVLDMAGVIEPPRAQSRKSLLKYVSAEAAELVGIPARELYRELCGHGTLHGAGLSRGAAILHVHVESAAPVRGVCVRLAEAVALEPDAKAKTDLLFLLFSPLEATPASLKALALVTRALRDPASANRLRAAKNAEELRALLSIAAASAA